MALHGVKVLEIAGLAPAPFCGMVLRDHGAQVVRVDRVGSTLSTDSLSRGKRSVSIDLKQPAGKSLLLRLVERADVLIDPFRPGVLERLGLGPEQCLQRNPGLIYARISGFGQQGVHALTAGHDINYIGMSGTLSMLGRPDTKPYVPNNLIGDFAGGGLLCALGIAMALVHRASTGQGQVVDTSMTDGSAYVNAMGVAGKADVFAGPRGTNLLDGGAPFYDLYETKDGQWMAVGALEPQFYAALLTGLGLSPEHMPAQFDTAAWPTVRKTFEWVFARKTRDEWADVFLGVDACVTPVLEIDELLTHPHIKDRNLIRKSNGRLEVNPAPLLSVTPGNAGPADVPLPEPGQHSWEVLSEYGVDSGDILRLARSKVIGGVKGAAM